MNHNLHTLEIIDLSGSFRDQQTLLFRTEQGALGWAARRGTMYGTIEYTLNGKRATPTDASEAEQPAGNVFRGVVTLYCAPAPVIASDDLTGYYKTGSLPASITPERIAAVLGFGPNIDDDPDKVEHSWGFTVGGKRCGIWDYRGARWSVYDPAGVLPELFADDIAKACEVAA